MAGAGTVTLLFTDLVGSTESLVSLGEDRYDSVRDEHEVLVAGTIAAHHGEVVKSTGDGYMAAFRRAGDAIAAAAEIQRRIATRNDASEVALGVRIGISAGDVIERAGDYQGVAAVEAARLCAAAMAARSSPPRPSVRSSARGAATTSWRSASWTSRVSRRLRRSQFAATRPERTASWCLSTGPAASVPSLRSLSTPTASAHTEAPARINPRVQDRNGSRLSSCCPAGDEVRVVPDLDVDEPGSLEICLQFRGRRHFAAMWRSRERVVLIYVP